MTKKFKRTRQLFWKYAWGLRTPWISPQRPAQVNQTRRLCAYRKGHPIHSKSQKRKKKT